MSLVALIGFSDKIAEQLIATLTPEGYRVCRKETPDNLPADVGVVFVCGDRKGWLESICSIRANHVRAFLVVATRAPDYGKWLDALEAGANDYCCTPVDVQQFGWLLRRDTPALTARATLAS